MIYRLILIIFLIIHSTVLAQTINWNTQKTGGTIQFENKDVTLLIVKFEHRAGTGRAAQIYNEKRDKFQDELEQVLKSSDLNYQIVSSLQLEDSIYSDSAKYPVVIDHGLHMTMSTEGIYLSFLHLYVIDRKSDVSARIDFAQQSTKYVQAYKRFIKKFNKGKAMKFRVESAESTINGVFAPNDASIELD